MRFPFTIDREKPFDVVGFGTNAVDFLIRVPNYPEFNSKVELDDYIRAAGGEVASTMTGLARLGFRTAYAGRFGDDDAGAFGRASLIDETVDVSFAETIPGAFTQIAFIVIDALSGERTVIWKRDARLAYNVGEAPIEAAGRGSVLHMTPHDTKACIAMAKAARLSGTIISTDVDNSFDGIDELLPLVDLLIMSADVPAKLTGQADLNGALKTIASRYGCHVVGVTIGEKGSLLFCENEFIESSGFPVPNGCQDTTGAGDAFRVGLISGLLKDLSIEEAARAANAVAALKCRAVGARTALPTESELLKFLQENI